MSEVTTGEKNGFYGKHHSSKTIEKIRLLSKISWDIRFGLEKSKKMKYNISKKTSGKNNGMYGKHHTDETREKCRHAANRQFKNGMPEKTKRKLRNGKFITCFYCGNLCYKSKSQMRKKMFCSQKCYQLFRKL
jgi:hypothetical protein